MKYVFVLISASVAFFALDMVWLGLLAKNFYREKLGFIFTGEVDWKAALLFYAFYLSGLFYFGILPGLKEAQVSTALLNSALFGLFCYATYDLTNKATIMAWPWTVVWIDLVWGIIVSGFAGTVGYFSGKYLGL